METTEEDVDPIKMEKKDKVKDDQEDARMSPMSQVDEVDGGVSDDVLALEEKPCPDERAFSPLNLKRCDMESRESSLYDHNDNENHNEAKESREREKENHHIDVHQRAMGIGSHNHKNEENCEMDEGSQVDRSSESEKRTALNTETKPGGSEPWEVIVADAQRSSESPVGQVKWMNKCVFKCTKCPKRMANNGYNDFNALYGHTQKRHPRLLKTLDRRRLFKSSLVKECYHSCRVCNKVVINDALFIKMHLKSHKNMDVVQYNSNYYGQEEEPAESLTSRTERRTSVLGYEMALIEMRSESTKTYESVSYKDSNIPSWLSQHAHAGTSSTSVSSTRFVHGSRKPSAVRRIVHTAYQRVVKKPLKDIQTNRRKGSIGKAIVLEAQRTPNRPKLFLRRNLVTLGLLKSSALFIGKPSAAMKREMGSDFFSKKAYIEEALKRQRMARKELDKNKEKMATTRYSISHQTQQGVKNKKTASVRTSVPPKTSKLKEKGNRKKAALWSPSPRSSLSSSSSLTSKAKLKARQRQVAKFFGERVMKLPSRFNLLQEDMKKVLDISKSISSECLFKCKHCNFECRASGHIYPHNKSEHNLPMKEAWVKHCVLHECQLCGILVYCDRSFINYHVNDNHGLSIKEYEAIINQQGGNDEDSNKYTNSKVRPHDVDVTLSSKKRKKTKTTVEDEQSKEKRDQLTKPCSVILHRAYMAPTMAPLSQEVIQKALTGQVVLYN